MTRRQLLLAAVGVPLTLGLASAAPPARALVDRCRFGAWAASGQDLLADHQDLERLLGAPLPVFSWFASVRGWDGGVLDRMAALRPDDPYDCLLCLEAWDISFAEIVAGAADELFVRVITDAARYPGRVTVRLFHEPNGNWYPWAVAADGAAVRDPQEWVAAWRRVVGLARAQGAADVSFAFCANTNDVGGVPVEHYWPGAAWVDAISVDGYNWGWQADGSPATTAEEVIGPMYDRLTALHPTAEFLVGELGCAEGTGKAAWFQDLYRLPAFPRLTRLAFFSERKEHDWRLNSDPATLRVNREQLSRAAR